MPETPNPKPVLPCPGWLKSVIGHEPDYTVRIYGPDGKGKDAKQELLWQSNPGPQTWAALCNFEEVLVGGRRGGGKSKLLIAKPAMGDLSLPEHDPARISFLNDPSYRALFLREEYQSMMEFVEEAVAFYKPFGGKASGDPKRIDFPTGARIYFNHLGDEEAFSKYKGWNLTFIGIEELTQIRTLKRYLKLLGSLRSVERTRNATFKRPDGSTFRGKAKFPALRTQIMSTTNPDGPGCVWVCERFVEVMGHRKGTSEPDIMIPWNTPIYDKHVERFKIFIPFTITDNPYLAEDKPEGRRYRSNLMSQDEVTRKQWMEGDWHAGNSLFFSEYRPNGPVGDEEKQRFPWARHVIKSAELKPWWYRWGSGDWGYDHPAAFHKACRNENDGRLHIYDEMQVRRVGSFEMGALLAKWWHPDLIALKAAGQDPQITIHMGGDAFAKDDAAKTKAQQMEAGIKEVLGPYGALLLKYDETEQEAALRNPKYAAQLFERRRKDLQGRMCIMLKPLYIDRVTGWDYMREMLRFRTAVLDLQTPAAREQYLRDVLETEGREAYERHAADLRTLKPEVLPRMLIWEKCRELDRCLKAAQRDLRNENDPSKASKSEDVLKFNAIDGESGDDSLDCLVAGTLVRVSGGMLPIELIRKGQLVWTRAGLRPVVACGKIHSNAPVVRVDFSDGSHLIGTRNHLVHRPGVGFVLLDSLRNLDTIDSWQSLSASCLAASSSDVIRNPPASICETISGPEETTGSAESAPSIKRFGSPFTDPFQKAITSTTLTRTLSTILMKTSNALKASITFPDTQELKLRAAECVPSRLSDAKWPDTESKHKKNARFIDRWLSLIFSTGQLSTCPASSADHRSRLETRRLNFATLTVSLSGVALTISTMLKWCARIARELSWAIGTARGVSAPVHVIRITDAGSADVYDLSVEGQPEYFANGILVHNSARNLVAAYKEIETTMPKSYFVNERMGDAQKHFVEVYGEEMTDPTRLRQIAQTQAALYDRQNPSVNRQFTFPRGGSQRHRVN